MREDGHANVGFLCDLFHLANNGDDVAARSPLRRHHRARADRRLPGSWRTRQRRARPRQPARTTSPHAGTTAGWGSSTSRPPRPRPGLPGCPAPAAAPTNRPERAPDCTSNKEHTMTTIAFIGLGIMGQPMSVHLQNAGYDVCGVNLSPERTTATRRGRRTCRDLDRRSGQGRRRRGRDGAGLARRRAGPRRRGRRLRQRTEPGTLIIDFSSIRPDVTASLAEQAREKGFRMLDAPVSGGEAGAVERGTVDHGRRRGGGLRRGRADLRRGRQDDRPRRTERLRPDREGGQPAHRRGQHRGARRGVGLPGGLWGRHGGRPGGARRRTGRLQGAGAEEAEHARTDVRPGLPDRPAPQGHGHRHLGRQRGRRRDPARRRWRPS